MNREIKFKAFVFGKMGEPFNPLDSEFMSISYMFPDETIFMQYTGLKDKNGKDIYEGDILRNNENYPAGVVKWNEKRCVFEVGEYGTELWKYQGDNKEIIGNIYENPELLK